MIVAPDIYHAILALEYRYARLLDDDRLEEWPELFVERGVYKVIPRENWHREPKLAILFCDSRAMMVDRVAQPADGEYLQHSLSAACRDECGSDWRRAATNTMSPRRLPSTRRIWRGRPNCSVWGSIWT